MRHIPFDKKEAWLQRYCTACCYLDVYESASEMFRCQDEQTPDKIIILIDTKKKEIEDIEKAYANCCEEAEERHMLSTGGS